MTAVTAILELSSITRSTGGRAEGEGGFEIIMRGMHGAAGADRKRKADEWIAHRLREIDYDLTHPEVQLLADQLQAAGIGTLVNMRKSNKLLSRCEKLVMCKLPLPPESWHNESQRLIEVAVRPESASRR